MVSQAVIVAAGCGMRLGEAGTEIPKGFLNIDGQPLIHYSLKALETSGITKVTIVVGHQRHFYNDLPSLYPLDFSFVENPIYDQCGSQYSLYLGLKSVTSDVLILDSDILYQTKAIPFTLNHPQKDVLLITPPTGSGDEVYVEVDKNGDLASMSKSVSDLGPNILGEMVGLTKISDDYRQAYIKMSEALFTKAEHYNFNYEDDGYIHMAHQGHKLHCPLMTDLIWTEIDTVEMYEHAKTVIWPKLLT